MTINELIARLGEVPESGAGESENAEVVIAGCIAGVPFSARIVAVSFELADDGTPVACLDIESAASSAA